MTADKLRQAIICSPLADLVDRLGQLVLPSVRLRTRAAPLEDLPLGASRFGGTPDCPAGFIWPERNGIPLRFIAQINTAEVCRFREAKNLNLDGLLYFFYDADNQPWGFDPKDRGGWRVIQGKDQLENLHRLEQPKSLEGLPFKPAAVEFEVEYRLPPLEVVCRAFEGDFDESRESGYEDLLKLLDRDDPKQHRMFGWPDQVQGDMRLECQLASHGLYCGDPIVYQDARAAALEAGQDDWILLLQVDSDDECGWMWGDCGRVYFWIRQQDLAANRFDEAWTVLQCY
jgi:uncharacterized protein YwqG